MFQRASPLMQRFVPFAAVSAANMVNIPLMRQRYTFCLNIYTLSINIAYF